jgi:hypothetical protein
MRIDTIKSRNEVIGSFMSVLGVAEVKPIDDQAIRDSVYFKEKWYREFGVIPFHKDFNLLITVWTNCAFIGLWMMTNGHGKLWLEKSKEIENIILHEGDAEKAANYIAKLIDWYNENREDIKN